MSARRPVPRPKRAGETFARTHHLDEDTPSSTKKPRFDVRNPSALAPDAAEDDAILELDEIGKGGQQAKRNAVNLDGFESDSSNEGFDARADAKAEKAKDELNQQDAAQDAVQMVDESDMFADLEEQFKDGDDDEELAREGKKKKKDVRFLDERDIDGQVYNSTGGGHVSSNFAWDESMKGKEKSKDREESSDSESEANADDKDVDEEIGAGGLKVHAPKLDAFNMKGEMEEGRFDAQGTFVRKAADPDMVHDSWLEGVSKKDMKRAKEAAKKRDAERRQKTLADDQVLTRDVFKTLIIHLQKGETALEALARLGKGNAKKKPKWQNKHKNRRRHEMELDAEEEPEDPVEVRRREAVEAITGAADQLMSRGRTDVYDEERELLRRQYARETGEEWVDPPPEEHLGQSDHSVDQGLEVKQWEYRWTDARDGVEKHGPYDGAMMVAWMDAGFFGDGVEFKRVGSEGGWSRSADFL
ncbi:MAG: hypothetical protein M1837_003152 [Sclerophora amabilis]|nr:MAG: hypothetical protein M1837_003152 [Sclerophora amabilis]